MPTKKPQPPAEPQWGIYCPTHKEWLAPGTTIPHQFKYGFKCRPYHKAKNTR